MARKFISTITTTTKSVASTALILLCSLFFGTAEAWGQVDDGKLYNIKFGDKYLYTRYGNLNCDVDAIFEAPSYDTSVSFQWEFISQDNGFVLRSGKGLYVCFNGGWYANDNVSNAVVFEWDGSKLKILVKRETWWPDYMTYNGVTDITYTLDKSGSPSPWFVDVERYLEFAESDGTTTYLHADDDGTLRRIIAEDGPEKWTVEMDDDETGFYLKNAAGKYIKLDGGELKATATSKTDAALFPKDNKTDNQSSSTLRLWLDDSHYVNASGQQTTGVDIKLVTQTKNSMPWFVGLTRYWEFDGDDKLYLKANADGTLEKVTGEKSPQQWTVTMTADKSGYVVGNSDGKYLVLDGNTWKATATSEAAATVIAKANRQDNEGNATLKLWAESGGTRSYVDGDGTDMKLVTNVTIPKIATWSESKFYKLRFATGNDAGQYLGINYDDSYKLMPVAEADAPTWNISKTSGGYIIHSNDDKYPYFEGGWLRCNDNNPSAAIVFTDFQLDANGNVAWQFANGWLNKTDNQGTQVFYGLEPARPVTYWDEDDWYYIEFQDYDLESAIYGKYLYNPTSGDDNWRLQRGKAETAQRWYVETTEEGYILRRHDEDGGGYFSWTERDTYYHISKVESEAFVFTDIEKNGSKFSLWASTVNGTHYLNADTWAESYDDRDLEKDQTDLKGVKSFFKLVKEVNDDPIPESHEVWEKDIKHRVHQLVTEAQEYKAAGGTIPQGFLDGSKEWVDNGYGKEMQYTSVYEFTIYVKAGEQTTLYFPMIQYGSMILHRDYQRFYNYRTDDLTGLNWSWFNFGGTSFTNYKNGYVTGISLTGNSDTNNCYVNNSFDITLPADALTDGLDLACDMSNYTDMIKDDDGDIDYEPSLSQRVIWHIRSAQEMADSLSTETWLEEKTIHFPATSVNFEPDCIGLERELSNYWFNKGGQLANLGQNGNILVELEDNGTGIQLLSGGQKDGRAGIRYTNVEGLFVNTDLGLPGSRFVSFTYPQVGDGELPQGRVNATGKDHPAYINVYAVDGSTRYKVARFEIIFDENSSTLPWNDVLRVNNQLSEDVRRSPNDLARRTGNKPIAQITFDYPEDKQNSLRGIQNQYAPDNWSSNGMQKFERTFSSSQLALDFVNANYIHTSMWRDDNGQVQPSSHYQNQNNARSYFYDCKWGEYLLTSETGFWNALGPFLGVNNDSLRKSIPASQLWHPADGMVPGFLYVDASERAGSVASVPFEGTFCSGNRLMCSGWICTGTSYGWNNGAAPSSVILSIVGRNYDSEEETVLHRFCPGQISLEMRHNDGSVEVASNVVWNMGDSWISTNGQWNNNSESGPWQQFYYEFTINEQFDTYLLKIDNNCVSTSGGDFMLDDIQIYASLPEVKVDESVPICVRNGSEYDVSLMKQLVNFDLQLDVIGQTEAADAASAKQQYMSFAFLEKDLFLKTFKAEAGLGESIAQIEKNINDGVYENADSIVKAAYVKAFWASLVGDKENQLRVWKSTDYNSESAPKNCGLLQFEWSTYYEDHPEYKFVDAIAKDKREPVYRYVRKEGDVDMRYLLFNANIPDITWSVNTYYYCIPYNTKVESLSKDQIPASFDLLSPCNKKYAFRISPTLDIIPLDKVKGDEDLEACENQIPTIVTNMEGFNEDGEPITMENLNFDWWIGLRPNPEAETEEGKSGVKATLDNYSKYTREINGEEVSLREAVLSLRQFYPDAETLDGVEPMTPIGDITVNLTANEIELLRQLVNEGQLILHTKLLNVRMVRWSEDDPNFYFVAAPINDDLFKDYVNPEKNPVIYYCDEPQQLTVKLTNVAPTLESGFSDGMNGIDEYNYEQGLGVLSLRMARMGQFQKVQHADQGQTDPGNCLVIPLREAHAAVSDAIGVHNGIHLEAVDNNIYLANTDDAAMFDRLLKGVHATETADLPVVGRIVKLEAVDTEKDTERDQANVNYMRIYFLSSFDVRDCYNYTLKIPFRDHVENGTSNACDGDLMINLKIVPDYEVWTGAAGNTDWNNDGNWRRADSDDLLLRSEGYAPNTEQVYLTNDENGRDKGFAPLYCTHLMIKTDEGAQRPVLYDMYDYPEKTELDNTPFPNLRPETATDILKYDFQACPYQADKHQTPLGQEGDLIAEMYEINVCEDIVFQSHTELLKPYLLSYNRAWVEYELTKNQWHLVGSPLQGTLSAEWYAPSWSGRQETTYYEPVNFDDQLKDGGWHLPTDADDDQEKRYYNISYDRFSPAVYQRAWDKAKAVIYEHGATWDAKDGDQTDTNTGDANQGNWSWPSEDANYMTWDSHNADDYLQRIAYRPMGDSKANVAIWGTWSGVYNDHTVPYSGGGFCVLPINNLKGNDIGENLKMRFRLPKDDQYYDIWDWGKGYAVENRVRVYINDGRELPAEATDDNTLTIENRGRLRSDVFSVVGEEGLSKGKVLESLSKDKTYTMELKNEGEGSVGYFLACNPFLSGLDMVKFFAANTHLAPFYLVLNGDEAAISDDKKAEYEAGGKKWKWSDVGFGSADIVAPRYAFFVKVKDGGDLNATTLTFTPDMLTATPNEQEAAPSRRHTMASDGESQGLTLRAVRHGSESEARVELLPSASDRFDPAEDMETFVVDELTADVPVVYTLCGRLATSINRLNSVGVLPLGIASASSEPCTVSLSGVGSLGTDSLMLYDAAERTLTPLTEGLQLTMPGRTEGRYFIVSGIGSEQPTAAPSVSITPLPGAVGLSSAGSPIERVEVYTLGGSLVTSLTPRRSQVRVPLASGTYIVKATATDVSTVAKVAIE